MIELQNILIEDPLRIRFSAGRSDRLVVCFSGVGNKRHEEPPIELFKVVGGGGMNPVLFVSDQSRSWLNARDMASTIASTVTAKLIELGTRELIFIGNSMGATMALQLARIMPVDRVIAFTPQFSASQQAVPEETRWEFFRKEISDYPFFSLDAWPDAAITFVIHGSTKDEMIHARRFPDATSNVGHFILPGYDHNLAAKLKRNGELAGLVSNMMDGRRWRVRKRIQEIGGMRIRQYLKCKNENVS